MFSDILLTMGIAVIFIASLVWLIIAARIYWRVQQKKDPITAVIPTILVNKAKALPKVIMKAEIAKRRTNYIDTHG